MCFPINGFFFMILKVLTLHCDFIIPIRTVIFEYICVRECARVCLFERQRQRESERERERERERTKY